MARRHTVVRPAAAAIAIAQDRRSEKAFLRDAGFPTAPFVVIETDEAVEAAAGGGAFPAILKTARFGYDGKGQVDGRRRATRWRQRGPSSTTKHACWSSACPSTARCRW